MTVVGLLHPGEMGAAVGGVLRERGATVLWSSSGRSAATTERAARAGLEDAAEVAELCRRSEILLSVCPPHAALDVARQTSGFTGIYVDANAISPQTARTIASIQSRFVDGSIVGPPPHEPGSTRLYLSGREAERVAQLFTGANVEARPISGEPGAASALKAAYAGWTKGSAALLLAARALARAEGVEDDLIAEWRLSLPQLEQRAELAARSSARKGWRWVGEMEEIARAMAARDLPAGFHEAAAEMFRHASKPPARAGASPS
jgi:3-hydroxyisobutyrate dehydrogenase-like beta-hydroxyacid dehydrogenase